MTLLEKLLEHFALSKEEYEELIATPSLLSLPSISKNSLVEGFLSYIKDIKEKGQKVLVYGDYDVDGITSTTILVSSLRRFGIKAEGYLPSRFLDGYGLTTNNVEKIASKGFEVILTCDNGISAYEAIDLAKEKGLTVLVLDHHERGDRLPNADAILHNEMLEEFDVPISAGELSYYFSVALLGESDPYYLTLGAMSALSDMMPMKGSNHKLVKLMLDIMNEHPYRPLALLSSTNEYDETTFGMEIIPKLNAIGRILKGTEINRLLSYFLEPDSERNVAISNWINEVNEKRKELTREAINSVNLTPQEGIVVMADIPEGLNGLLANRLMQTYHLPTVVFSKKEGKDGALVGSVRSKDGFNVLECIRGMENVEFLAFGGHEFAGGVTIKEEDYPLFEKQFIAYSAAHHFLPPKKGIPLKKEEVTLANYHLIRSFAPFGTDFECPIFTYEDIPTKDLTFVKEGQYLSVKLSKEAKIFSFSVNDKTFEGEEYASLNVVFTLEKWKGKENVCLKATANK